MNFFWSEILQMNSNWTISCNCLKTNCASCSCSKYGLKCTELCGCGELCENAPVLEDTGHSVESDIEEGEEDDLPSMSLD